MSLKSCRGMFGLLAAGVLLGWSGFAPGVSAQQAEVKVALVAPISGAMARAGQLMQVGAQLAIEDINAQGGIKALGGAKMRLVIEDAGNTVETAKNAAQRLVANQPDVVAGTGAWSSSLTLAITEVSERAGLPWLTLSYADQITDRGFKYVVQTVPVASVLAGSSIPTVLEMAQKATGKKPEKVAIISDSTAASQAFVKPLRDGGFQKLGVSIVVDEVYTSPLTDATTMVQKLRATKPDFLLYYSLQFPDAKLVLSKMGEFGLGQGRLPTVTVGVQLASPEMLKAVGAEALQGMIVVAPNWPSKAQEKILPGLTNRSGEPWLNQDTISTYGDMWLIKDALERAGSTDKEKLIAALRATATTTGPADYYLGDKLAFDDKGRRLGGAVGLIQWQGGKPLLVWPAKDAVAESTWARQ
jgi:branched-chain amino acid transport system substrate-binding protein